MGRRKKPSLIEDRTFPFECSISYGVEPEYRKLHWHTEMEICCIRHGTGKHLINGRIYNFAAGDIFLINNDEIHLCYEDQDLEMLVVMFDSQLLWSGSSHLLDYEYLRPFLETEGHFCNRLDGKDPHTAQLTAVLDEIEREYLEEAYGFELMIKALLLQFLTLVIRYFSESSGLSAEQRIVRQTAEKVKSVMAYVEQHYTEQLTLEQLAQLHGMSPTYLCSTFKRFTGLSPIDFVIRKRISAAKQALVNTEQSVLEIAQQCGFQSISNFNHLFKTLVGCAPRQYRSGHRTHC